MTDEGYDVDGAALAAAESLAAHEEAERRDAIEADLRAEVARLKALLAQLEWSGSRNAAEDAACPCCGAVNR